MNEAIKLLQRRVFRACGGGWLGYSAAERPAEFYIDSRLSFRRSKRRFIRALVQSLCEASIAAGLNPKRLPSI